MRFERAFRGLGQVGVKHVTAMKSCACWMLRLAVCVGWLIGGVFAVGGTADGQIPRAADAPQPLSPARSAATVQLPPGFRLELIACEPVVEEPSCVAFDEFGRIFVCELHGYNVEGEIDVAELNKTGELDKTVRRIRWELQGGAIAEQAAARQYGKLKLLVDDNGDGVMDRAEVWADDLPACYGIVPARGGILVVCAPDIVFFADHDQDGLPEVRETLFTGFKKEVLERGINNPRWGLDNWIYVGSGGSGGTITGPHLEQPVELGRSDFRIRADGSALEPVQGSVGTFGMTVNDYGDRFPASGGEPANYALPLPYHLLARNPHVATPRATHSAANYNRGHRISAPHPWRVQRRSDPAWIKFYGERETDSNYFSGGCSNEFYADDLFPPEYRNSLFYCEPSLNIVHRCVLTRDGLRYRARRAGKEEGSEFLASTDTWFRPMNLRMGPEGALYIVDMYREIIEDYSAIPRFLQQQYGLDQGRGHGRLWRLTREEAPSALSPDLSRLTTAELVSELGSAKAWRRRTAQRLLVERKDDRAVPLLKHSLEEVGEPLGVVAALYTLEGLNALAPGDLLLAFASEDERVRMHAIRLSHAWLDRSSELLERVVAARSSRSPVIRAEVALALGESSSSVAREALLQLMLSDAQDDWMAAALLSSSRHHALGLLSNLLERGERRFLRPLAATVGGTPSADGVPEVLGLLAGKDVSLQNEVLAGLLDGVPDGHTLAGAGRRSLAVLLASADRAVQQKATQLALRVGLRGEPVLEEYFRKQVALARDTGLSPAVRIDAMESLSGAPFAMLVEVADACLGATSPPEIQVACIALFAANEDAGAVGVLLESWPQYSPAVRTAALDAIYSRADRLPRFWRYVEQGKVQAADLTAAQQEQLLQHLDEASATLLRRSISASTPEGNERLGKYLQALAEPRELGRGKVVFEKTCAQCHRVGSVGHKVGPDLGTITNKPDAAVLSDILDPNSKIDPEYRSYNVVTHDGRSLAGILVSESATNVILIREDAKTTTVLRRDIEEMRASDVSLMPANLHDTLTPSDAAHLMHFLRTSLK